MAMILVASSDWLGAPQTEGWLRKILVALFGPIPVAKLHALHLLARKAGHVAAYAILSWLSYRSARGPRPAAPDAPAPCKPWKLRAASCALGFSLLTAALDETRQVFTRTRSGSLQDVALDMAGALLALLLIWILSKRKRKAGAPA